MSTAATPARRRRLMTLRRRPMLTFSLGLIAVVLITRLVWGTYASHRLNGELAQLRQHGEPVTAAEFVLPPVPDDENAWVLQWQACVIVDKSGVDSPATSVGEFRDYPPFSIGWTRIAAASEQAHAAAFTLARRARERERVRISLALPRSGFWTVPKHLNPARRLANVLGDSAVFQHVQGHDAEAIERCHDLLHLAHAVRSDVTLVSQLVAVGIDALAAARVQAIAPGLRLDDPAARTAVQQLIARLLDESSIQGGMASSFSAERCTTLDEAATRREETLLLDPAIQMQAVTAIRWSDVAADVLREKLPREALKDFSLRQDTLSQAALAMTGVPRFSRWFETGFYDGGIRYFTTYDRVLADRRMAAVSLVIQLYRHDHGHWPQRLDELVPTYLPAVPADPFSASGASVGYEVLKRARPDGQDRPMVYCDEGPATDVVLDEPMFGYQMDPKGPPYRKEIRQYRDVSRWMPAKLKEESLPPLTPALRQQRVDGDPDIPDSPEEEAEADEGDRKPVDDEF